MRVSQKYPFDTTKVPHEKYTYKQKKVFEKKQLQKKSAILTSWQVTYAKSIMGKPKQDAK